MFDRLWIQHECEQSSVPRLGNLFPLYPLVGEAELAVCYDLFFAACWVI